MEEDPIRRISNQLSSISTQIGQNDAYSEDNFQALRYFILERQREHEACFIVGYLLQAITVILLVVLLFR